MATLAFSPDLIRKYEIPRLARMAEAMTGVVRTEWEPIMYRAWRNARIDQWSTEPEGNEDG